MNLPPLMAGMIGSIGFVIFGVAALMFLMFMFFTIWASRYVKVGPNQVLIISGRKQRMIDAKGITREVGYRLVSGGGTFVWPVLEKVDLLSLEVFPIDFDAVEVWSSERTPVHLKVSAQFKIKGDEASICSAAEHFLSKTPDEIRSVVGKILEIRLRDTAGDTTTEDLFECRKSVASKVREAAATQMAVMGIDLLTFSIPEVRETLNKQSL